MKNYKNNKKYLVLVFLLGFYFLVKSLFFNKIIYLAHPPDLGYHKSLIEVYSNNHSLFFINELNINQRDLFTKHETNFISTEPFLYHSFIGRIWNLVDYLNLDTYVVVSFIQTILGFLTLYFIYKLAFLLTKEKYFSLFCVFIAGSIPMFSFLINYLNYDNLTNFISSASIYYLIKFLKNKDFNDFNSLLIYMLAGSVTKISYGPLFLFIVLVIISFIILNLKTFFLNLFLYVKNKSYFLKKILFLFFFVVVSLFYCRNLFYYKSFFPDSLKITGVSNDFDLRETELVNKNLGVKRMGVVNYFINWEKTMEERTFNIVSHKSLVKPSKVNYLIHCLIISFSIILFIRFFFVDRKKYFFLLMGSVFFYVSFLFIKNYQDYLTHGEFGIATQGRYLFPIIAPIVILFSYNIYFLFRNKFIKLGLVVLIVLLFFYIDFGYVIMNYKEWRYDIPKISFDLGNTEPIYKGMISPFQIIEKSDNENIFFNKIALYSSTYLKKINTGVSLNLYEFDCKTKINSYIIKDKIKDNAYFTAYIGENLSLSKNYCFNIENIDSEDPFTLWYSSKDLPGYIYGDSLKDLIYQLAN